MGIEPTVTRLSGEARTGWTLYCVGGGGVNRTLPAGFGVPLANPWNMRPQKWRRTTYSKRTPCDGTTRFPSEAGTYPVHPPRWTLTWFLTGAFTPHLHRRDPHKGDRGAVLNGAGGGIRILITASLSRRRLPIAPHRPGVSARSRTERTLEPRSSGFANLPTETKWCQPTASNRPYPRYGRGASPGLAWLAVIG